MSITDELREQLLYYTPAVDAGLTAIVDRIDAEYQKAEDEWKAKNGVAWLAGYTECHDELMEGNEAIAADLENAGWVRLPKDADGEVIHIGDMMDTEHFGTVEVEGFVHHSVAFYNYSEQPAYLCTTPVNLCHHHHVPTVEDVLREFYVLAVRGKEAHAEDVDEAVLAEYAAKLRLADGGEEQ